MPRKCSSTYSRPAASDSEHEDAPEAAVPAAFVAAAHNVVITQEIFGRMADQMRLLTEGLAFTKSEVDAQKVGLAAAKVDLANTNTQLGSTKTDLAEAKARNVELRNQLGAQDSRYAWQKHGNGEQHKFNCGVLNTLTEAATALEEGHEAEGKAFVKAGIGKLAYRNKLIRMADSSPVGWAIVDEYEQSELADSAEDDQRIRRAETAAIAKRKRKLEGVQRGGKSSRGKAGRGKGGYNNVAASHSDDGESDPFAWFLQQAAIATQAAAAATEAVAPAAPTAAPVVTYPRKPLGPCYYCGGPHLQSQCTAYKQQQALLKAHQAHLTANNDGESTGN